MLARDHRERVHSALTVQPEGLGSPRRCRLGHTTQNPVSPPSLRTPVPREPKRDASVHPGRLTTRDTTAAPPSVVNCPADLSSAVGQLICRWVFDQHHHPNVSYGTDEEFGRSESTNDSHGSVRAKLTMASPPNGCSCTRPVRSKPIDRYKPIARELPARTCNSICR